MLYQLSYFRMLGRIPALSLMINRGRHHYCERFGGLTRRVVALANCLAIVARKPWPIATRRVQREEHDSSGRHHRMAGRRGASAPRKEAVAPVVGHDTRSKHYDGQVDAFGVFCPAIGTTYLIPVDALGRCGTTGSLRVAPARNGQRQGIRLASDFLIGQK